MSRASQSNRHGFSLVELLVVIGIIAVLVGILLPVLGRAREASHRAQCLSNQKQIAQSSLLYAMTYKTLPGPAVAGVLDPEVVNRPSATAILNTFFTIRMLSHKDLLQPFVKVREVWFCPSSNDMRLTATPGHPTSAYSNRALGYTYKINNQTATTPAYFFGSWVSSDSQELKSPKKLAQVRRAGGVGSGNSSHATIWMVSDLDSFNYAGPTGSNNTTFGITAYPPVTPGYTVEPDRRFKPVHKSGGEFGRCYTFFDGHGEYLLRGNWPENP